MTDPNFAQTVTLVCEHNEQGALGIVINRPLPMTLGDVFTQLGLDCGPVEGRRRAGAAWRASADRRGFVLHSPGPLWDSTLPVSAWLHLTTSARHPRRAGRGEGPAAAIIALGYSGWDAGQLEAEVAQNAWLTVPADERLLFETALEERWRPLAGPARRQPAALSSDAGPRLSCAVATAAEVILASTTVRGARRRGRADHDRHRQAPAGVIPVHGAPDWAAVERCVREWSPARLLVGVPYNMDGTETVLTATCRAFARQLARRFGLPVDCVDERLTSAAASADLREARRSGARQPPRPPRGHRRPRRAADPRDLAARSRPLTPERP